LITGGMFLAWRAVQTRYGNLDLNRICGLAQPMPRFSILLSLLVMAAMGLPPFGLFSGFIEMLLNRSIPMSWDLTVILLAWLAASWFFFNLMRRLLFGTHRTDILYTDLRRGEAASLVIVLLILLAIGLAPYGFFESNVLPKGHSAALELSLWKN
jgi:NADH-quinone oxidoreductase subunit M